jgi:hypothetical protein
MRIVILPASAHSSLAHLALYSIRCTTKTLVMQGQPGFPKRDVSAPLRSPKQLACLHSVLANVAQRVIHGRASAKTSILMFAMDKLWGEIPLGMGTQNEPDTATLAAASG